MISEKRLAFFVLLGPPLGFATFLATAAVEKFFAAPHGLSAPYLPPADFMIWGVIFSYGAGIVPALLTYAVDEFLARRLGRLPRAGAAFCAGFVFSNLVLTVMTKEMPTLRLALVTGLIGAVPAVVCSGLAGRKEKEKPLEASLEAADDSKPRL